MGADRQVLGKGNVRVGINTGEAGARIEVLGQFKT